MMEWLTNMDNTEAKAWEEIMIDYSYSSDDWQVARDQLLKRLQNDQKQATERDIRAYLSCCAESVGSAYPLPDLCDIVDEFYERFGMENSKS